MVEGWWRFMVKQVQTSYTITFVPSQQILYLKNLSNKVHQQDLESIFNKFLPEGAGGLEYRVLTGRMRGQAFITFPGISLYYITANYTFYCICCISSTILTKFGLISSCKCFLVILFLIKYL